MNGGPSCVVEEIVEDTPTKAAAADHRGRDGGGGAEARGDADAPLRGSTPSSSSSTNDTTAQTTNADSSSKPQLPSTGSAAVEGDSNGDQQQQDDTAAAPAEEEPPQQQRGDDDRPHPDADDAPEPQQQVAESTVAPAAAAKAAPAPAEAAAEQPPPPWEPGSDDERAALAAAEALKADGNAAFGAGRFEDAAAKYQEALAAAPELAPQRATYHANLAAAYCKMGQHALAVEQATCALRGDPKYVKALMRRAAAYEALDDPERAAADARSVLELDPSNAWAKAAGARLAPAVAAKQEALKAEMLSKLKELGNSVLGRFGLSLDNFKAEQDPETGGYSIKFQK